MTQGENDSIENNHNSNTASFVRDDSALGTASQSSSIRRHGMGKVAWPCVVVSLLFSIFLFALDNTVLADVQPSILETFGNQTDKLPWVTVSYALGGVCVNLFVSRLFVYFNNKFLFVAGVIIFEAGSALCGAAPTIDTLIVGRAVCGVGSAGIYSGAMNLLSAFTTEAERPVYLSFVGLMWGLGTVLGPIVGGSLASSAATWRWAFYLNLCVGAVLGPIILLMIPSFRPQMQPSNLSIFKQLDILGAILNAGACASLVMPIAFGGGIYPWNSGQVIGLFICSAVLWTSFIVQQYFAFWTTRERRIFPVEFVKSWEMDILFVQTAASVTTVFITTYFVSFYFQFVQHDDPLHAGIRLLPFICFQVFGVILNGVLMGKLGYYMPWFLAGGIFTVIGSTLFYTCVNSTTTSTANIYGYSIILGLGAGFYSQAAFPIAQVKADAAKIPIAVQFIGCGQISGITLSLALSTSIFTNEATNKVVAILPQVPRSMIQPAISGVNDAAFLDQLNPIQQQEVLEAILSSIDNVFIMVITAGMLSTILALFMRREKLFQEQAKTQIGEKPISEKVSV
ncbi:hypothetical protein MMC14_009393 [Varicellaria rhodocarpa]|nr:hypothetical protein [Varicellaria rhodocarpa]